jgi:hypothetical protein
MSKFEAKFTMEPPQKNGAREKQSEPAQPASNASSPSSSVPEKSYSPTTSEILEKVAEIRSKDSTLGISKVFAALKIDSPTWNLSEKRLKKVVTSAVSIALFLSFSRLHSLKLSAFSVFVSSLRSEARFSTGATIR